MKRGAYYVLLTYIIWGSLTIYWKQLSGLNAVFSLSMRVLCSVAFCAILISWRGSWKRVREMLRDSRAMKLLIPAGIMIAFNWGFYIYAVTSGHILDAGMAYFMNPILAILLGAIVFKEKLSSRQWAAVLVVGAGLGYGVFVYGQFPTFAFVIAGSFAIYGALKKGLQLESEIALFVETSVLILPALGYLIYSGINGTSGMEQLNIAQWILLLSSGAITSIPLLLYAEGMKTTSMSMSGILMYINPTIQLLIGALLYKERLSSSNLVMFVCIFIAMLLYVPTVLQRDGRIENKNVEEEHA